ncbi:MAG: MATE family efflux transporter [Eubacteriales bacterium]
MDKKNQIDMTTGSIVGKQVRFIIPLFFTGMLQLLYNAVDVIIVGRFAGTTALSAVGSTGSLTNLLINALIGLSVGTNVVMATYFGSKDEDSIQKTLHTSLLIAILAGLVLTIVGILVTPSLLVMMATPDDVIEQAIIYMRIIFLGMTFNLVYNFSAAILRATGDTKRPLRYLGIAGIINVILNLIFVVPLQMDVAGVALATIISQGISVCLIIRCLLNSEGSLKLQWSKLYIHKEQAIKIIKVGLPAGLQTTIFAFSNVLIQSSINSFGSVAMAGNAASASLEGFLYTGINCVQQSVITFAGQNKGAKQYDRIRKNLYCGYGIVVVIAVVMSTTFRIFGEQLIGLYTTDPEAIAIGINRLTIFCMIYFSCGLMDTTTGFLRGVGRSLGPMIITVIGVCGFRVIWIFGVFTQFRSLETLYVSYPISWSLCWIVLLVYYLRVTRNGFENR